MVVMHFDEVSKRIVLTAHHPGISVDEVLANTGFPMATAGAVETDPPLDDEIRPLHEVIDPEGFFLPHPWAHRSPQEAREAQPANG
jgi:glutaconate CoA-transferase subunit B